MSNNDVYLGNPLLKKANTTHEFTEEQVFEIVNCMKDPVYFANNYVKIVTLDHGLQSFKPYHFQEKLINNFHKHRFNICKMPRQTGKMLSLDTPIPTPTGWTTMGDLNVGDLIFARDGKTTKVIGKSPIQQIDTYEIEFDNGEIIKACGEHLWKVSHSDWYHKEKILTTNQIIEKFNCLKKVFKSSSIYIQINESIDLPEINLPIDPYTLGVWLGDGSKSNGAITGLYEDIKKISEKIPLKITTKSKEKSTSDVWRFYYQGLRKETHVLKLNEEKIIPEEYLRSSTSQRLELLRGLMDTDGSVSPNGACEFYQKDGKLLHQVRELLSSLGIKSRLRYKKISGYSGLYGTISFCTNKYEVFTLPRKLERQKNSLDHPKNKRLYIKDIRKIETEPMQCISVDNQDHLFLCGKTFIPTHNSTTVVAFLLHYAVFNDNVNIGILANKAATARELLDRLQTAYENLPKWMQQGIISWNKGSLELENGSKILAASTSASAVRGMSFNILFLDEFAFVPNHIADSFFASVYPTITSGKQTKVIIVSTPHGMNHFYRMWHDAEKGKNEYIFTDVHWSEVPGRDEEWKKQTIANTSEQQFKVEFECEFLGSVDTLISPSKLRTLVYDHPKARSAGLDVYEDPIEEHDYLITVDVARGVGNDYSAFTIIDITQFPHKVVAKYRHNEIKPMLFPSIIHEAAVAYNNSYILCEVNDVGDQVASILQYDLEYNNLLMCSMRGRAGQIVGQGFSGKKTQLGVKMSKTVKKVGCLNLKTMIEESKLILNDYEIISELTTFIQKHNSFEAEEGCNDDLAMCLVIYAWLVAQDYFKELTDQDVRKRLYEEQKNQIEQDMSPFGFISDGLNEEKTFVDEDGDRWFLDEYGDRSTEWDYMWKY
jgi:hypothetical protein